MQKLDLPMGERYLTISPDHYHKIQEELETFLIDENFMKERKFARKVILTHEIKTNNSLEGILDDISLIETVIKDASSIQNEKQRLQIINLYQGYKYILSHRRIGKEELKELYGILSNGLLNQSDLSRMGRYYREEDVYILLNGVLSTELDKGVTPTLISTYVDKYFEFINSAFPENNITDSFIKSQIMHFYLEYIHPYYDVNSRTTRTMAIWYLIQKKAYPFVIFNRGITFDKSNYERMLVSTKKSSDASLFIKYMMERTKIELEKEHIMQDLSLSTPTKLSTLDYQTLNYFLEINGEVNVLTFASLYNYYNGKKKVKDIYEEMIDVLIQKGILQITRTTNKEMFDGFQNECLRLNPSRYSKDSPKIKRLDLTNK